MEHLLWSRHVRFASLFTIYRNICTFSPTLNSDWFCTILSEKPVLTCAGVLLPLLVLAPFTTWILFKGLRHQPDRQLNGTGQPRARDLSKNMTVKAVFRIHDI
jgi:hypothetical protein